MGGRSKHLRYLTSMSHEQLYKGTWHHTLIQNLKAQVYEFSPHLYDAQLFHFYSM